MTTQISYSFDVGTTLNLGAPDASPLPEARDGEIILRIPAGISLLSLRDSRAGKALLRNQDWYITHDWAKAPLPAGTYCLRLPITESSSKNFTEQQSLLQEGEAVPPVTLLALILLCCQKQNLPDPLNNGWVRCQETAGDVRVALGWVNGQLLVFSGYWDDRRFGDLWAAGARKIN